MNLGHSFLSFSKRKGLVGGNCGGFIVIGAAFKMKLNYVLSCIATIVFACVTHCIVQSFIEHCVNVITIFNSHLLEEFSAPQRAQRRTQRSQGKSLRSLLPVAIGTPRSLRT